MKKQRKIMEYENYNNTLDYIIAKSGHLSEKEFDEALDEGFEVFFNAVFPNCEIISFTDEKNFDGEKKK